MVARYNVVKDFRPEEFWYIFLSHNHRSDPNADEFEVIFRWDRERLFHKNGAISRYQHTIESRLAIVTKVEQKNTRKLCVLFHLYLFVTEWLAQQTSATHDRRASKSGFSAAQDLAEEDSGGEPIHSFALSSNHH